MITDRQWLDSLMVGDLVAVSSNINGFSIRRIDAAHKLHFIVNGAKYRRADGYGIGGDIYYRCHIEQVTDSIKATIVHARAVRYLETFRDKWKTLPITTLQAIICLLPPKDKEPAP